MASARASRGNWLVTLQFSQASELLGGPKKLSSILLTLSHGRQASFLYAFSALPFGSFRAFHNARAFLTFRACNSFSRQDDVRGLWPILWRIYLKQSTSILNSLSDRREAPDNTCDPVQAHSYANYIDFYARRAWSCFDKAMIRKNSSNFGISEFWTQYRDGE